MGGLRRVELVALDGDSRPVAFADAAGLTFVLDAAAAEVLVFEDLRPDGVIARLPTGPEPSSLATGYYGADGDDPFVAVANGGSGDISVWRRRASGAFEGGERVAVGERPSAIVAWSSAGGYELAVANADSGTVTILSGRRGHFTPRMTLPVGGRPTAMTNGADRALYAAPTASGVSSIDITASPVRVGPSTPLPVGTADVHLDSGLIDPDRRLDLAVADRTTGTVSVLHGQRGRSKFGAPVAVLSPADPTGLAVGNFGGDWQNDVAVADTLTGAVQLVLTPGDRVVAAPNASEVGAGGSVVFWSWRAARGSHRLMISESERDGPLPIPTSRRPISARFGTDRDGHPVLTYVRCTPSCRPYVWNLRLQSETRLRLPVHHDCVTRHVAMSGGRVAYDLLGRCPTRLQGVRIRDGSGRTRRVGRRGLLGDLEGSLLTWLAQGSDATAHVRLRRLGGSARTLDSFDRHTAFAAVPQIERGTVYWSWDYSVDIDAGAGFAREVAARPGSCKWFGLPEPAGSVIGYEGGGSGPSFALSGSGLLYEDEVGGVFELDRSRVRWRRC
jgi:hypothetical protein